ncbi:MAG: universal stress protein [Acidimicrobiales bacterium]
MYTSIVVGTDGSATATAAVAEAARMARSFDAQLHVVGAYEVPGVNMAAASLGTPGMGMVYEEWDLSAREVVDGYLEQAAATARREGTKVDTYAVPGNPVGAILDVARTAGADLIVVGNRGMAGARRVLGSVPNTIAHKAHCTVLIVKTC